MIEAVIFDMDGLLINSEGIWQDEEKKIFGELGIDITPDMHRDTYGLGTKEVIEYWYKYKPWKPYDPEQLKNETFDRIEERIRNEAEPLPGVKYIINFFKKKKIKLALASASPLGIIYAGLERLKQENAFQVIHSCELESHGKPHPAVYLTTAEKLGTSPLNCLVFEDSLTGLLAAKAARMKAVAVPSNGHYDDPKYVLADIKIQSLQDFTEKHFEMLKNK